MTLRSRLALEGPRLSFGASGDFRRCPPRRVLSCYLQAGFEQTKGVWHLNDRGASRMLRVGFFLFFIDRVIRPGLPLRWGVTENEVGALSGLGFPAQACASERASGPLAPGWKARATPGAGR